MFKVNIIVEDSKWRKEIPTIEKMLKKNVKKIYLLYWYYNCYFRDNLFIDKI